MTFPSSSAVLVCAYGVHRVLISKYSCVQSNYQKLIAMLVNLGSDTIRLLQLSGADRVVGLQVCSEAAKPCLFTAPSTPC